MPTEVKKYSEQELRDLFRSTATSREDREEFAAGRAEVILPMIDVQSTIRRIFAVENIGADADASYDIPFDDIECAWIMPQIGGIPTVQVEGDELDVVDRKSVV
jgi:hypothetical protein